MVDLHEQFKDFKSFEVVFKGEDEIEHKLFCAVKSIESNQLLITADNEENHNIVANEGVDLKLYIYTEFGIYSSTSKIISATHNEKFSEYIIAYPANSKHSQRREYFRADLNIDFHLEITPKESPEKIIKINSKTRNLCGKGMSYISNSKFPEYELIELTLHFAERNIETSATLVYSKQIVEGNKPKFIHAFSFNTITSKDIDLIVKKCFLHQLELRKKLNS
jgi:c-di-GMP-binding flagellar brake protein YcgR